MFKDYVANDIESTFINLEEFAEEVEINGAIVSVVEDREKLEYRMRKTAEYDGFIVGDIIGDVLFFISKEEYEKIPKVKSIPVANMAIKYKGKPCMVNDVNEESGVYEIVLQTVGG